MDTQDTRAPPDVRDIRDPRVGRDPRAPLERTVRLSTWELGLHPYPPWGQLEARFQRQEDIHTIHSLQMVPLRYHQILSVRQSMCSWLEAAGVEAAAELEAEVVALHLFDLLHYPLDRMPLGLELEV